MSKKKKQEESNVFAINPLDLIRHPKRIEPVLANRPLRHPADFSFSEELEKAALEFGSEYGEAFFKTITEEKEDT